MKTRSILLLIAVAAVLAASAGSVSAAYVASFAGPKQFSVESDIVVLTDGVSIGQEGGLSCEFKSDNTDPRANGGYLWYCADTYGGTKAEYRVLISQNLLKLFLWSDLGGYAANIALPFTDTTSFHSLDVGWKEGSDTFVTLDGVTTSVANAHPLDSFVSGAGLNTIGALPLGAGAYPLMGQIQNFQLRDTYAAVPEPSTLALIVTGVIGLLAYAWRKRK
jgi:hypothetical protein